MYVDHRNGLVVSLSFAFAVAACGKAPPPPEEKPVVSSATAAALPTPPRDVPTLSAKRVKATFLIDSPLEKIKGVSDEGEGNVSLVVNDLAKTTGILKVKLSTLRTETFGDKSKDESQTDQELGQLLRLVPEFGKRSWSGRPGRQRRS